MLNCADSTPWNILLEDAFSTRMPVIRHTRVSVDVKNREDGAHYFYISFLRQHSCDVAECVAADDLTVMPNR